jgi:recombination protein U
MIKYPSGVKKVVKARSVKLTSLKTNSYKNRGMTFEEEINQSNAFYLDKGFALIHKRPTPVNIVKVDYTHGAKITHAYFEKQSTTDYNGVYKGRYLDFEAKSTMSKTAFPIANITRHQLNHLQAVINQGGIAFFLISFTVLEQVFLLKAADLIAYRQQEKKRSIPLTWFQANAYVVTIHYEPRIHYLPIVEQLFF